MVAPGEGNCGVLRAWPPRRPYRCAGRLRRRAGGCAETDPAAAIQADEALHALRRYRDRLELDPGRLAELERRIAAVMEAARKYRVQPEEPPALGSTVARAPGHIGSDRRSARLAAAAQAARAAFESVAAELTAARLPPRTGCRRRSPRCRTWRWRAAVLRSRSHLAHLRGRRRGGGVPCCRECRPATAQPRQGASGGELSRIGLAIQVITSRDSARCPR